MIVKYSTRLPWWINNEEDKPDRNAFTQWNTKHMVEGNYKLNMGSDYSSLTLITDKSNIFYVEVDRNNRKLYYYANNVKLIASNTYTIELTIDLWGSFFMDAFFSIIPNKEVFIKRCHNLTNDEKELTKIQDDPVLDNIKPIIGKIDSWGESEFKKINVGSEQYTFSTHDNVFYKGVGDWYDSLNTIALYQDPSFIDAYILIPLPYITVSNSANFKIYDNKTKQITSYKNWKQCYIEINNAYQSYMNNFIGVFSVPNWLIMSSDYIELNLNGQKVIGSRIKHKPQNEYAPNLSYKINKSIFLNNKTDLLSPKILDYIPMFFGKDKINSNDFKTFDGLTQTMNNIYFDFNGTFIGYFQNEMGGLESWPKKLPGPLKSTVDKYKEYVAQNQNRINAGIQSSTLGLVQGIGMIGLGAATGNPFALTGGFQGMMGAGHSILNRTATILDLKNSLVPKQKETYVIDNMYDLPEGNIKQMKQHLLLFKYELKNLVEYNNAVVLYGFELNNLKTFQSATTPAWDATHYFISFKIDYYKKVFNYIYRDMPLEFQEIYLNLLDKGLRIWNTPEMEFRYA